ncbi:MAG TPA: HYR domain-containing protein, partial [Bacteroidales bacterium]|nr:HYR domain-containing protein [Bacteroidales bacterium]
MSRHRNLVLFSVILWMFFFRESSGQPFNSRPITDGSYGSWICSQNSHIQGTNAFFSFNAPDQRIYFPSFPANTSDSLINVGIFQSSLPNKIEVKILPDFLINADETISEILYTIRWDDPTIVITTVDNITPFNVQAISIPILDNGYYYQVFGAVPMSPVGTPIPAGSQRLISSFSYTGSTSACFELIDNEWTVLNNGGPSFEWMGNECTGIIYSPNAPSGCAPCTLTLTCPSDITKANDTGNCGAIVSYTGPVVNPGSCTGVTVTQTAGLPSGSLFPAGTTLNSFLATSNEGATAFCSFIVTITSLPGTPGNITGASAVCQGQNGVPYSISPISNATSYVWSYSGTGATINGSGNSITINFSTTATSGNLTVYGVNNCGVGPESPFRAITVNALPGSAGNISGPTTVCQGQNSVSYNVPTISNATNYVWSYSGTGATIIGNGTVITINFSSTATSGDLTVYGANSCGNGTLSPAYPITVNTLPGTGGTITGTSVVIQGQNGVSYSVPVIPGATSYVWSYSGTGITINGSGASITIDFGLTATSGNLTVYGVNSCGNGVVSPPFYITVNPLIECTITGPDPVCAGSNDNIYSGPGGVVSYTWSITGGNIVGNTDTQTVNVTAGTGADFTLSLTIFDGTATNTCETTVMINTSPSADITPDPASMCVGGSINMNGNPSGGSGSYTTHVWTGTGAMYLSSATIQSPVFSGAPAGTYSLTYTVTDNNGCSGSDNITVTVNPNPSADITPDPASMCVGGSINMNGNPSGGSGSYTTHSWTGTGATYLSNIAIQSPVFSGAPAGTYSLTYTVTDDNGCSGTDNITVSVSANPSASITPDPAAMCVGGNIGLNGNPSGGSGSYTVHLWTGTGATYLSNTAIQSPVFSGAPAGTYSLTYTVTDNNGCSGSDNITVTVNPSPSADITPDPASMCVGGSINMNGNPSGGSGIYTTHTWTGSGATYLSDAAIQSPVFSGAPAGTYSLTYTVTDNNGCSGSDNIMVTVNPSPSAGITPDPAAMCVGGSINMNGNPSGGSGIYTTHTWTGSGATYLSDAAIQSPVFSGAPAGTYSLTYTVTDNNGCSGSDNITVTVNTNPSAGITPDPASMCVGGSINMNGNPAGGSGSYTTHAWTGTGATYLSNTSIQTPVFSGAPAGTYSLTYSVTDNNGCSGSDDIIVTVNPLPTIALGPNPSVCKGTTTADLTYSTITGSPDQYFIDWNNAANTAGFIDVPFTALPASPIVLLIPVSAVPTTYYGILKVRNSSTGCESIVYNIAVTINPVPTINPGSPPSVCQGATSANLPYYSPTGSPNRYSIDYDATAEGQGFIDVIDAVLGASPIVLVVPAGAFPGVYNGSLTVKNAASGCVSSVYPITVTIKPIPELTSSLTPPGICSGTVFNYTPTSSTSGTLFSWVRNTIPEILESGTSGTGDPNETLTNITSSPVTVTYIYTLSASGCTNPNPYNVTVVVSPLPVLTSTTTPPPICSGNIFSYDPQSSLAGTAFQWSRATVPGILPLANSGTGNPGEVLTNTTALPIPVTYVYTLTADGCQNPAPFNVVVTVNPSPVLSSPLNPPAICSGTVFSYIPASNTPGTTFSWSRAAVPGISNPPNSGTGNPDEILYNTTISIVNVPYVYTLTANGCTNTQTVTVGVKPSPTANPIPNQSWCHGVTVPVTQVTGPVAGTSFTWVNSNTAIGLGASGTGNIPSFTATNLTNDPIVAVITITPLANECTGSLSSYTITVSPSPQLTSTLTPSAICSGTEFSYDPTSNVANTTFAWSRAAVPGISNLAATGTGNPHEILNNTTVLPVNVTYIYILTANGCTNPSTYAVVVTVNPVPVLTSSLNPQPICSNTLFSYTPTSGTPGTVFNWNRPVVPGISNPAGSGTGNPNEILINTTGATVSVTYIYTLSANGCTNVQNVIVDVKPTPAVNPVANQEHCNGDIVPETILTGPVAGTTFTWTNNNTSIGLGASGSGNVPSFTAINTGSSPQVAIITVTPSTGNCPGSTSSYTITVNPSATVNPIPSQAYCNGDVAPATVLSGPIPGTTFSWTNNNTAIGLPASGQGDVPSFTALNATISPISATITITPAYGTCPGLVSTYTITVNPTPTVNPVSSQTYCENATVPETVLSGTIPGTTFSWVNNNIGIGLAASGIGNIPSFIATNDGDGPITSVITIIPTTPECSGITASFTITVNPIPELSSPLSIAGICSGETVIYSPTSLVAGTTFSWVRPEITGIEPLTGSGNDGINEVLDNITLDPIVVNYIYTLTANNCSNTQSVTITITQPPLLTINEPDPPTVCSGHPFNFNATSETDGTTFTWTRPFVTGISNPPGAGTGDINETLINITTNEYIPVTYYYTLSSNGCTNSIPEPVTIIVVPAPIVSVNAIPNPVCPGEPFDLQSSSNLGGTLPSQIYSEDFNTGTAGSTNGPNGWTTTLGGGTPSASRWTLRNSPYWNGWENVNSGDGIFYHSNSRQGFGTTTNTSLISPIIPIPAGYNGLTLTFRNYYNDNTTDNGFVEVQNVATGVWVTLLPLNSDRGTPNNFQLETVSLNGYITVPNIRIRFRYVATNDRYWAVDNVVITGTSPLPAMSWSGIPPLPPGFPTTDPNPTGVSQTQTTSYIATYVDTHTNCPGSDTVTVEMASVPEADITADYCTVPGKVVLTAHPSGMSYLWTTGATTQSIQVDEVGQFGVTVTNTYGCSDSYFMQVSNELVVDGSFTNFVPAAPSFVTEYTQNQGYYTGVPSSGLWPEGYYAVNTSAWSNWPNSPQGYHPNFHGRDHTNNTSGPRNFMMINGSTTQIEDPPGSGIWRPRIIWQQTVTVTPNTNYYFSAWGMNLNPANSAILQFEVNGVLVGTIVNLDTVPKPASEAEVSLSNWRRFHGNNYWNSGSATTAVIRIRNLNTLAGGNDFGLDDISFGTLDAFPTQINIEANGGAALCEGDTLYLEANAEGGLPPITFSWTGPNGFSSNQQNPIIPNVAPVNAGEYILSVQDGYGCPPITDTTILTIIQAPMASISASDTVCVNDPEPIVTFTGYNGVVPYTFYYTFNGGQVQSITTTSGNSVNIAVPTNAPGIFTYTLVSVTDLNGCDRPYDDMCTITVGELPVCSITGITQLCPGATGNVFIGPAGLASYSWSITGNGTIIGSTSGSTITVTAGPLCDSTFTLRLTAGTQLGCTSQCSMTVPVQDITLPVWTTAAGSLDRTLPCSDVSGLASAQALAPAASDNCTFPLTPVKSPGEFVAGNCPQAGTYTNSWTATDGCGNSASTTFTQVITIIDDVAPVWTTPPGALHVTLDCSDASGLATAQAMLPAASDNCDATILAVKTSGPFVQGSCQYSGTYTNTFIAADDCGNAGAVYTQVITITDNAAPVITCPNSIAIDCDESTLPSNTGTAVATDNCDPTPAIGYADVTIPGLCPQSYTIQRTWTATDACSNAINCIQLITVQDFLPPVLEGVPDDVTVSCEAIPTEAQVTATDNCDPSVPVSFNEINNVVDGCGTIIRTWSATDDCSNPVSDSQTLTVFDNTPPLLIGVPADMIVSCDNIPDVPGVTATDNCDPTVNVTFEEAGNSVVDGCGEIVRTWSATDHCGNSVSDTQTITVEDTDPPYWITAPNSLNLTVQCSDAAGLAIAQTLEPVASDNCDPTVIPVKNPGPFVPGGCPQAGTYTNTWTASDNCGNTGNVYTQVITVVDNTGPVWDQSPGFLNRSLACADISGVNAALALAPTATDNCGTALVNPVSDVTIPGICSGSYVRTRKWSTTDNCGNTNTVLYTQTITVTDNTAPVWDQVAGGLDASVACDDSNALNAALSLSPSGTDECGSGVIVNLSSDDMTPGNCPGSYTIVRTWTASDGCGNVNAVAFAQTITVTDTTQPVFYDVPINITISCEDPLPGDPGTLLAFDNCSDDVTADIVFNQSSLNPDPNCPNGGTISNTWTVDDGCGNIAIATQVITITDDIYPQISFCPESDTVQAEPGELYADVSLLPPVYSDNCTSVVNMNISWTMTAPTSGSGSGIIPVPFQFNIGTTQIIYYIADECGNSETCTFFITVLPNDPPDIICPPDIPDWPTDTDVCTALIDPGFPTVLEGEEPIDYYWSMSGATSGSGTGTISPNPYLFNAGTTTIRWIAVNTSGADTCYQTVAVVDMQAPVVTIPDGDSLVECVFSAVPPVVPNATDNCDGIIAGVPESITDVPNPLTCEGTRTYTYSFTDLAGNTASWSYTYIIDYQDFIIPANSDPEVITCASDLYTPTPPAVTDNCGELITPTGPVISPTPPCEGNVTYQWNYTDCAGNSHTWTFTFTIEYLDFTMPEDPDPEVIACASDLYTPTQPAVTDNCGNPITPTGPIISPSPPCEGNVTYQWNYADCAGNSH